MTKIHAKASSTSYARRYLMCMIWNIATHDDDDGQRAGAGDTELISDKQKSTIVDLLNSKGITEARLLKYLQVESIDDIPASKFNSAVASIKATPEKTKGGEK
jgi:predicted nucleotidyltransferase